MAPGQLTATHKPRCLHTVKMCRSAQVYVTAQVYMFTVLLCRITSLHRYVVRICVSTSVSREDAYIYLNPFFPFSCACLWYVSAQIHKSIPACCANLCIRIPHPYVFEIYIFEQMYKSAKMYRSAKLYKSALRTATQWCADLINQSDAKVKYVDQSFAYQRCSIFLRKSSTSNCQRLELRLRGCLNIDALESYQAEQGADRQRFLFIFRIVLLKKNAWSLRDEKCCKGKLPVFHSLRRVLGRGWVLQYQDKTCTRLTISLR